jgi:uncharacterized protein (TIGR03437 family)
MLTVLALLPSNASAQNFAAGSVTVVDAASYRAEVAPGSIAAAFGVDMTSSEPDSGFDYVLAELSATIGDYKAKLFYASATQVNFFIPDNLPVGVYPVVITNSSGQDFEGRAAVVAHAPSIFTVTGTGRGAAAALYTPSENQPANVYVSLFTTGIGLPPNPTPETLDAYRALTLVNYGNDLLLQPSWLGPAPGFYGLVQINVAIPREGCTDRHAIHFTLFGGSSQQVQVKCPAEFEQQ